eukprot:TRINITY_DN10705_c0_g1_i11.p1 TRINITY_DN10705_c0_g1~~TRINITY_DN10705_c0_g1_i11.p1  ORF type:complete len:347 (-),score=23.10 TRINITY_DN10705_c0_g1_i11:195-1235(-)
MNGAIREKLKIIPENVTWGGQEELVVYSGLTNGFKKPRITEKDLNPALVLTLDPTGKGNFTTIQAAVNASPDNAVGRTVIRIAAASYWEKVIVSVSKTNLTFQGQGLMNTIIARDDTAGNTNGTYSSASVAVDGYSFRDYNISFRNAAPPPSPGDEGKQAVALRIGGDAAAFFCCGFYGAQDTLLDDRGRHYFKDCFIEGSIDFIFGHARSLYEDCKIHLIAEEVPGRITGSITAQERKSIADKAGFSFLNCTISGTGQVWLGRALSAYPLVVFIRTFMPANIAPAGWDDLDQHNRDATIFFGEYECQGPGANNSSRVGYYKGLNHTEAAPFMNISFIDGDDWLYH